jgi:hypothetical protein
MRKRELLMARCVAFASQGASAPDVLVAAPEPCSTFVLISPAEYSAVSQSPLNLTPEQGALIGSAILLTWAMAWGWRALEQVISDDGVSSQNDQ